MGTEGPWLSWGSCGVWVWEWAVLDGPAAPGLSHGRVGAADQALLLSLQIYSPDHSSNNFSSNPSTPVGSPQGLAGR